MAENSAVDQYPMWVGDRIYFLSERNFPVNVWSSKPDGSDAKQLTKHTDFDVRSAEDGRGSSRAAGRRHRLVGIG